MRRRLPTLTLPLALPHSQPSYEGDMGSYTTEAAEATVSYLQTVYPGKTRAECYNMLIVTPMIGVNDVSGETFTLADASTVASYAASNALAGLAMWALDRYVRRVYVVALAMLHSREMLPRRMY